MAFRTVPNWPPVWTQVVSPFESKKVHGEVGVLKAIQCHHNDRVPKCFLIIEHENERYFGALLFDDSQFCYLISKVLGGRIGCSIAAIGDLDLSITL